MGVARTYKVMHKGRFACLPNEMVNWQTVKADVSSTCTHYGSGTGRDPAKHATHDTKQTNRKQTKAPKSCTHTTDSNMNTMILTAYVREGNRNKIVARVGDVACKHVAEWKNKWLERRTNTNGMTNLQIFLPKSDQNEYEWTGSGR